MKDKKKSILFLSGLALALTSFFAYERNQNNYQISNSKLSSYSRATGYLSGSDKVEYTKLKDGSEEIFIGDGRKRLRYQNLDGNDTIDRIRIDKILLGDATKLEDILIRKIDYTEHKADFDRADDLLKEERKKF